MGWVKELFSQGNFFLNLQTAFEELKKSIDKNSEEIEFLEEKNKELELVVEGVKINNQRLHDRVMELEHRIYDLHSRGTPAKYIQTVRNSPDHKIAQHDKDHLPQLKSD